MITPTPITAPVGTEIVCIKQGAPVLKYVAVKPLEIGRVYVVSGWWTGIFPKRGLITALFTDGNGFVGCDPKLFRLLDLAGLDDLLKTEASHDLELIP